MALILGAATGALLVHRSHPPPQPPIAPARWDDRIALKVEPHGDGLRVLWNVHAPAVRDASRATLLIHDGGHTSQLDLRPSDLATGVASYWPQTRDVTFRLQLSGASGDSDDSVRAFAPPEPVRPSPFVAEARPRPAPPPVAPPPPLPVPHPAIAAAAAKPQSGSRVHRIFRKIPLLGRLHRPHRPAD